MTLSSAKLPRAPNPQNAKEVKCLMLFLKHLRWVPSKEFLQIHSVNLDSHHLLLVILLYHHRRHHHHHQKSSTYLQFQLWHVCNLLYIRHLQLSICRLRRCIGAGGTALMWVQRCRCIIFAGSYKSTTLNTEGEKNAGAQMQVEPSTHLELYA